MKQGWNSILTKIEQDNSNSFIGGKPCIPKDELLPICNIFFSDSFSTRTYVGRKIFSIFLLYMYMS